MSEPIHPTSSKHLLLFDRNAVMVATVIGSLIAGALLVWWNYRSMGRMDLAKRILTMGIVTQGALLVLALSTIEPNSVLQLLPLVIQLLIAWFGTEVLQGAAIRWHRERGASLQPIWRAAWFGLLTGMVILFVFIVVSALLAAAGIITLPEPPPTTPAA